MKKDARRLGKTIGAMVAMAGLVLSLSVSSNAIAAGSAKDKQAIEDTEGTRSSRQPALTR